MTYPPITSSGLKVELLSIARFTNGREPPFSEVALVSTRIYASFCVEPLAKTCSRVIGAVVPIPVNPWMIAPLVGATVPAVLV